MRNSDNRLVIFPLIVRAEYSCLGEATQQGTILWASTYKRKIKCSRNNDRKNKVNTHEMRMRSAASVFIPITLESGEQIKRENSLGTGCNQDTEHPISTHLLQIGSQTVRDFSYLYEGNVFGKFLFDVLQPLQRFSDRREVCHHGPKAVLGHKAGEIFPGSAVQQVELDV